jgi:hypothetical protein
MGRRLRLGTTLVMSAVLLGFAAPAPASAGLLPGAVQFVEATAFSPGVRLTSVSARMSSALLTDDLLVAWVAQYDASGPVRVSDSVDGAWTRGPSLRFANGGGDIALFWAKPLLALTGVTVSVSASTPTFLAGSIAHYRGMLLSSTGPSAVAEASASAGSTTVDAGPTPPVPIGDLVFAAEVTGGLPGTLTPGESAGRQLRLRAVDDSGSAACADVLSGAAGAQNARFTLGRSSDWYAVVATFDPLL